MCEGLSRALKEEREKAERLLREWENEIRERDLAEKRRVAPGYLDTGVMMLEPVKRAEVKKEEEAGGKQQEEEESELDKAFGRMAV